MVEKTANGGGSQGEGADLTRQPLEGSADIYRARLVLIRVRGIIGECWILHFSSHVILTSLMSLI